MMVFVGYFICLLEFLLLCLIRRFGLLCGFNSVVICFWMLVGFRKFSYCCFVWLVLVDGVIVCLVCFVCFRVTVWLFDLRT